MADKLSVHRTSGSLCVVVYLCILLVRISGPYYSLRQASLCRATKQLMPTPRGRRPPPTPGGGSGLSYLVFRGALPGRCLASGGVRLRSQGTGRAGRGKGGKEGEEKRREEVEWRWLWWVGGKGRREGGEGMLVGSGGASTGVRATTSTVSPPTR